MKAPGSLPRVLLPVLASGALFVGCDSNDLSGNPPEMPPPAAFIIDGNFPNAAGKGAQGLHHVVAAAHVGIVSAAIGIHLIVPAAVTHAAVEAGAPTLQDDVWLWTSNASPQGQNVGFTLAADTDDDEIDWSMRIQWENPETDDEEEFELYRARTNPNDNSGSWELFYPVDGTPRNVLDAEYAVRSETDKEITFSVPPGSGEHAGDTVRYEAEGDQRLFYRRDASEGKEYTIRWNEATKAGSIIGSDYNGGQEACWDAQLNDVPC